MWLSKVKLQHFKSYESAEFNFDAPQTGRNIVLIGAQNGHGKTTLLEACIYACTVRKQRHTLNVQAFPIKKAMVNYSKMHCIKGRLADIMAIKCRWM